MADPSRLDVMFIIGTLTGWRKDLVRFCTVRVYCFIRFWCSVRCVETVVRFPKLVELPYGSDGSSSACVCSRFHQPLEGGLAACLASTYASRSEGVIEQDRLVDCRVSPFSSYRFMFECIPHGLV